MSLPPRVAAPVVPATRGAFCVLKSFCVAAVPLSQFLHCFLTSQASGGSIFIILCGTRTVRPSLSPSCCFKKLNRPRVHQRVAGLRRRVSPCHLFDAKPSSASLLGTPSSLRSPGNYHRRRPARLPPAAALATQRSPAAQRAQP